MPAPTLTLHRSTSAVYAMPFIAELPPSMRPLETVSYFRYSVTNSEKRAGTCVPVGQLGETRSQDGATRTAAYRDKIVRVVGCVNGLRMYAIVVKMYSFF